MTIRLAAATVLMQISPALNRPNLANTKGRCNKDKDALACKDRFEMRRPSGRRKLSPDDCKDRVMQGVP